ncbi:MAG: pseudouridine synthase, partial [Defluviitaleaceae bacterium]|nr:pseudouridine synthase [Defluviitaleaceae bacterium]
RWCGAFPAGRLDKDTEGLVIITNDGIFAHRALSPKKHVDKIYFAKIDGDVSDADIAAFARGVVLDDEYVCRPAHLEIIGNDNGISEICLTIHEGKFHQVKRMFEAIGHRVIYLKRTDFAGIALDEALAPGEYRPLNESELAKISNLISKD